MNKNEKGNDKETDKKRQQKTEDQLYRKDTV